MTFFCVLDESFARLLPNDRALFPPLCIWRTMKIQNAIISRIGAHEMSTVVHAPAERSSESTMTPCCIRLLTRPS